MLVLVRIFLLQRGILGTMHCTILMLFSHLCFGRARRLSCHCYSRTLPDLKLAPSWLVMPVLIIGLWRSARKVSSCTSLLLFDLFDFCDHVIAIDHTLFTVYLLAACSNVVWYEMDWWTGEENFSPLWGIILLHSKSSTVDLPTLM